MVVNGRSYFGSGPRKRDARNEAARKAKSSLVEDQLKNQQKIKEKIGELKKIRADLKCRLKNLKAQSKLNQKALKNLGLKRDKPKELKEKKDESKKKASKPSGKEGMGTVNPTENPKKVGKRREKEKRKTTAQSNSFQLIVFGY